MSIAQEMRFRVRMSDGLVERPQRGMLGYGDQRANKIIIEMLTDSGALADLTGVTAAGSFYAPPDGDEIALSGTISGNVVTLALTEECYAAEGHYSCEIRLTSGNEKRTVLAVSGHVLRFGSGAVASVAGVTNIDELLAEIGAMREATAAANSAVERASALIGTATAENLLDNSYFADAINQRGDVMYSGTAGYKIDRWRSTAAMTWIVASGAGISLRNTGAEATGIAQIITDTRKKPQPGERVTLAAMDNAGNLYCGAVTVPESGFVEAFRSADGNFWGLIYPETISGGNVTPPRIQLMLKSGAQIILRWAALYRGEFTADTLPPHRAKTYAQELAECQRYYFRTIGYNAFYGYTNSAGSAYLYANLPAVMRTIPTVTLTGATLTIRAGDGSTHPGVTIVGANGMHGSVLRLQVTDPNASLPPQMSCTATVSAVDGVLEISAEP